MGDDFDKIQILSPEEKDEILRKMNIKQVKSRTNHNKDRYDENQYESYQKILFFKTYESVEL